MAGWATTNPWALVWAVCSVALAVGAIPPAGAVGGDADPTGPTVPGQILVQYRPGTTAHDIAAAEAGAGAHHVGDVYGLGVRVLRVPPARSDEALNRLRRNPKVEYAEPDGLGAVTQTLPDDTYWPDQWGPAKVNSPTAWDTTTGDSSLVIAVLDTGVAFAHPDLSGAFVPGWDFVNHDSDPADDHGHGTSVAGIAAARTNNSIGMAGMCWNCRIMPVKVATSSGSVSWSTLASGITWASDQGAHVISMSISGASSSTTLANAAAYAYGRNVVLVAAAGNTGDSALRYPAALPEVISVAGSDAKDSRYSWSTYGSWVDVAAPGCNFATTMAGGYRSSFCGTSSATPVVAGIAGLLISSKPGAVNTAVEDAIRSSATPVGSWVGHGRADAAAALTKLLATTTTTSTTTTSTSTTTTTAPSPTPETESVTYSGSLNNKHPSRSFTVTTGAGALASALEFTKAPSLTLTVLDPAGAVVAQGSGASVLRLSTTVTAGTWTVTVSGATRATFTLTLGYAVP